MSVGQPTNVGIVGCGTISGQYLRTIDRLPSLRLTAVADLDAARAQAIAATRPQVRALTVDELVADPRVDIVLNLTVPAAHAAVALAAIAGGKDVYGEKPLAADTEQARPVLAAAEAAGVRVGCAPDTVLGTGIQTARRAIDDGVIGTPAAATATMVTPGHERWHPNPDFYYLAGGGPLLDMGPYYLTALVTLLGPVTTVVGAASRARAERVIGSGPRTGQAVPVLIDTHVTGVLIHRSGALSTLLMSFDGVATRAAPIEVHGSTASLMVPDPNKFDGEVRLRGLDDTDWRPVPTSAGYLDAGRGYGLADLAATPRSGRSGTEQPRAGAAIAFHVLDVMESLLASAGSGQAVTVRSTCPRPAAVPLTSLVPARTTR
ncbi:Gfo/Idh/MocA family protein [Rugosimonospora africana]|uniref:Oxidoreductase n=1 Tax=Rugosimonospora africana TaxID=556532 RepID=A0A8J3R3D1_9ACTN|nr:Gfo/Idh/MocA family oxidoreductase [Rugosimonospora africana]GIH20645.1 oxidoreductase [Rugosimonospora africana]